MSTAAARTIWMTEEIHLPGKMTPARKAVTGCSEAKLARSMAEAVSDDAQDSPASALAELRAIFPDMPLSLRIAALGLLMRRRAE